MLVLPQDQIDTMVSIMEYILKIEGSDKVTVGEIKERFHLSEIEYQMIYDLCMPLMRKKHSKGDGGWRKTYLVLKSKLYGNLRHDKSETADRVREILQQSFYEPSKKRDSEEIKMEGESDD